MSFSNLRFVLVVALLVAGCGASQDSVTTYVQQVRQSRLQRDMQMREEESVLPPARRNSFKGLQYFDVDSTHRYVVPLHGTEQPDTVKMMQSTGGVQSQLKVGTVTIPLPDGREQFSVFRVAGDGTQELEEGALWLPFRDPTNGNRTYKAGRYVDIERPPDADSLAGNSVQVTVDFNRAYNPTCAYNPEFACPIPPPENKSDAPIRAGEKTPLFSGR